MASGIESDLKKLEDILRKRPDVLSKTEESKIWKEVKGCASNNKGSVEDAFKKFEAAVKKKYSSYSFEKRKDYQTLKKSIIGASGTETMTRSVEAIAISGQAPRNSPSPSSNSIPKEFENLEKHLRQPPDMLSNADAKQIWKDLKKCVLTDVNSGETASAPEMVGKYKQVIQVAGNEQAKASTQDNNSTSLLADRLCDLVQWLHDYITGVSIVTTPPIREEDQRLSDKHTVTYSKAWNKIIEIKDLTLSKMAKDKQSRKREARYEDTIRRLQEELREQRMSFEEKQQKWGEDMYRLQQDKDQIMTRMSKMSGDKLTQNNPKITDLSDPNRPQKLAEKFGELYDNEWTDVLDILKNNMLDKRERQCMDTLSDVLKMCYDECERVADSQMAKLKKDILFLSTHSKHQDVPESVEHGLVEAQSSSALFTTKAVVDIVTASLLQEKHLKEAVTLLPEYTTRCIEVCWGMVARQPRMVLQWADISQGRNIDKDTLFDGPGDTLGFVVWPALLLHKSGPLMSKGVLKGGTFRKLSCANSLC